MPFHNASGWIGSAIDSVLGQTFEDFELILVDDASTDDFSAVLARYNDPRIRLIRRDIRGGAGAARNTGIRAARSDILSFLDSDDTWKREKIKLQYNVLQEQSSGVKGVVCGFELNRPHRKTQFRLAPQTGLMSQLVWGCALSPGSTLMVKRPVYEEIGYYNETLERLEDWDWLIRYARKYDLAAVDDYLTVVNHVPAPDSEIVKHACEHMRQEYTDYFRGLGVTRWRQFHSALLIERAGSYYRNRQYFKSGFFTACGLVFAPDRGRVFYGNLIRNIIGIFSARARRYRR